MSDPEDGEAPSERTVEVAGHEVLVQAPEAKGWVRSPGDVMRLIVATLAVGLSVLFLAYLQRTAAGLASDFAEIARTTPGFITVAIYGTFGVIASLVPLVVLIWILVRRRWRLLGLYFLTSVIVSTLMSLLADPIKDRVEAVPDPPDDLPAWTTDLVWTPEGMGTLAAALVVSAPWMSRRWRRMAWLVLFAVIPFQMFVGVEGPAGLLVGLATGWFVGSATVVAFGAPQRNPTALDVVEGLASAGIGVAELRRASVDARGSTPYFAVEAPYYAVESQGRRLFIKVLGADERSADLMFRVYRWVRLSGVGDERPFSSLKRAVEHEAMVSALAERAGVETPPMVAPVVLKDDSMALVYERIDGRSLDKLDPAEMTDELLLGIWTQVQVLRTQRIAHRDLRLANVFVTDAGEPMLIDFGFGEVAASDTLLDQDVAQLVVSTAVRVGAQRAVDAAITVVGADAVAAAAPRMQPLTLAGATQHALKKHRSLLEDIYARVVERTSLEEVEVAKVERIRPRTVVLAAMLFLAVWILIPQLADLPRILQQIEEANWVWAVPAVAFSMLTYVGAALALSASVAERLSVARTTLVTLGGSFVNRVTPAKVGGIALNLRYLQKQGVDTAVAASSIGLYQGVGITVHLSLLAIFAIWAGRTVSFTEFLPSGTVIFIVAAVVLVVIGVALGVPRLRHLLRTWVWPQLGKIKASLYDLLRSPGRLVVLVFGSALLTLSYIGALWASIEAFGGGLPIAGIAVVFLAGASIAAAAPTPGGIGAVEAALIAGLTALGLASAIAVPAVFLYRLATFWVPIIPGWIGFTILQRRGDI
jgi:uncharacterized protein (TIRG00374 family)